MRGAMRPSQGERGPSPSDSWRGGGGGLCPGLDEAPEEYKVLAGTQLCQRDVGRH